MKNKYIWIFLISIFAYHTFLMQIFPWEKYYFNCNLSSTNIKRYNVPKTIELEINGLGYGKFINDQYFGTRLFNLKTRGTSASSLKTRILGSSVYYFHIPYKENLFGYEWGYTHMFDIPKKNLNEYTKSKRDDLNSRSLMLMDIADDRNNDPIAFWDCDQTNI